MRVLWSTVCGLLLLTAGIRAQDEDSIEQNLFDNGEERLSNSWGLNIQISTAGFVFGGVYHKKLAPMTFAAASLDLFWVNGKNEQTDWWTGRTINGENILMLPLMISVKRRVFADDLSNTFRPFVTAGVGGAFGWYIDGQMSKSDLLEKFPDHDPSQVTYTVLAGVGSDFGRPGDNAYGVDIKYQVLRFPDHLGQRKKFDNVQLGFHVSF